MKSTETINGKTVEITWYQNSRYPNEVVDHSMDVSVEGWDDEGNKYIAGAIIDIDSYQLEEIYDVELVQYGRVIQMGVSEEKLTC